MRFAAVLGVVVVLATAFPGRAHPLPPLTIPQENKHFVEEVGADASPVLSSPWVTEHHDDRNSGQASVLYRVGDFNGTCQLAAARTQAGAMFSSTGVTSSSGRSLYVGRCGRGDLEKEALPLPESMST